MEGWNSSNWFWKLRKNQLQIIHLINGSCNSELKDLKYDGTQKLIHRMDREEDKNAFKGL